jgi:magnesium chelatase family protein
VGPAVRAPLDAPRGQGWAGHPAPQALHEPIVYNVLLIGPPGTGKSMLAARLRTILPPLTPLESLETTRIYSATGRLPADEPLMTRRPFRTPHHTISDVGMVGGGNPPAPGEISLANHRLKC